jgi:esterase
MLSYEGYPSLLCVPSEAKRPPLVILPGLFGVSENWQRLALRFSAFTTVYVLNLPFHGRSKGCVISDATPFYQGMAETVHAWLQEHGISRVFLLGHSMGGKVGMQLSARFPEMIAHLVVLDICPVRYAPSHLRVFEGLQTADMTVATRTLLDTHLKPYIPDPMQRGFFLKQALLQPEGGFVWAFDVAALYARYPEILAAPEMSESLVPTTLLAGEHSEYMAMASVAAFQRVFPNHRVLWLATGHWVQVQDPDGVFDAVKAVVLDIPIPK